MQTQIIILLLASVVVFCQITPSSPNAYYMTFSLPTLYSPFNGTTSTYHIAVDRTNLRTSQYTMMAGLGYTQSILIGNVNYAVYRKSESDFSFTCRKQTVSDQTAKYMMNNSDILHTFLTNGTFVGTSFVDWYV